MVAVVLTELSDGGQLLKESDLGQPKGGQRPGGGPSGPVVLPTPSSTRHNPSPANGQQPPPAAAAVINWVVRKVRVVQWSVPLQPAGSECS